MVQFAEPSRHEAVHTGEYQCLWGMGGEGKELKPFSKTALETSSKIHLKQLTNPHSKQNQQLPYLQHLALRSNISDLMSTRIRETTGNFHYYVQLWWIYPSASCCPCFFLKPPTNLYSNFSSLFCLLSWALYYLAMLMIFGIHLRINLPVMALLTEKDIQVLEKNKVSPDHLKDKLSHTSQQDFIPVHSFPKNDLINAK